jgi:hypothetical protein
VTTDLSELRLRRILLAVDITGAPPPAFVSFAIALAARFEAELQAMLLTRTELTRAASLPFATEVSLLAGAERRLSASLMERTLQLMTARVQAMMAELAAPARVRWSLMAAGKPRWEDLLADLGEGNLLIWRDEARHVPVPGAPGHDGVCVIHDETPAGRATLVLAEFLEPGAGRIAVAASDPAAGSRLVAGLMSLRPRTVILPAHCFAEYAPLLRPALARLGCTVVVVG